MNIEIVNRELVPKIRTLLESSIVRRDNGYNKYSIYSLMNSPDPFDTSRYTYLKGARYSLNNPVRIELLVKDRSNVKIDLYSLHFNMNIVHNKEDVHIDWVKFNAISIGSFIRLYNALNDKQDLNKDQKMIVKKTLKTEEGKPLGVLGSINEMKEWKWLPSKKEGESYQSYLNHMMVFSTPSFSPTWLDDIKNFTSLLENLSSEYNIIKLLNRFLYGEDLNYIVETRIIRFDEPKSLIECIQIDIDDDDIWTSDRMVGFHNTLKRNLEKYGDEDPIVVDCYRSYGYSRDLDFYDKLPLHKYHTLYFKNWVMGSSSEYESKYDSYLNLMKLDNKFKKKNIDYKRGKITYPTEQFNRIDIGKYRSYSPPILDEYAKPNKCRFRPIEEEIKDGIDEYYEEKRKRY